MSLLAEGKRAACQHLPVEYGENPSGFFAKKSVGQQQPSPMAKVTPVDLNRNRPSYRATDFSFVSLRAHRVNACGAQLLEVVLPPGSWNTFLCGQCDP